MNKYLLLALLFTSAAYADTLEGRVVGVTDGDTITLLDANNTQYKIRLAGIDAPEKKQPFGQASKKSLSDLAYGKAVQVDWSKRDRYERLVGKVMVNGLDANLEQIKRGLAWHYSKYKKEQPLEDRITYLHAQEEAKANKLGLWLEPKPVAPWDWRKQIRL
ncbi:thermonuclease family protein [Methylotenera mobilis]|uniref:thermonuclease family protein n=1 Tax=Methylotenera mobilis TaxID=359408 RepID=UPI000379968C|nr:thermonuclease family protein [Methylotenera mobilis]